MDDVSFAQDPALSAPLVYKSSDILTESPENTRAESSSIPDCEPQPIASSVVINSNNDEKILDYDVTAEHLYCVPNEGKKKATISSLKKTIRNQAKKIKRLKTKVKTLKGLLTTLKKKDLISSKADEVLKTK